MPSVYKAPYIMVDSERRVISTDVKIPQSEPDPSLIIANDVEIEETAREKAANIVRDAHTNAEQILAEAKENADKLLYEARLEVADMFQKNRDKGIAEGFEEGRNKGIADTNTIKAEAEKLYQDTLIERQQILDSIESEVVTLLLDILDKLVSDAVYVNPQIITYLIRKGLNDSTQAENIVIHVSPDDFDIVSDMKNEFITSVNSKIEIVSDNSLKSMDCVIETQFGSIDCSLEQQYTALKNDLYYMLKNR